MRTTPLVVRRNGAEFSLRRISDNDLHRLRRNTVPIEEDHLFWMIWNSHRVQPRPLSLPEFFVAMSRVFGRSGSCFYPYKCSFSFPFHMTTTKRGERGDYLLLVGDWKGGLDARLRRCTSEPPMHLAPIAPFVEAEFSREDFREVMVFLDGFCEGYLEATSEASGQARALKTPDFARAVDSALMLYGFRNGEPFEDYFDDHDAYGAALEHTSTKELLHVDIGEVL